MAWVGGPVLIDARGEGPLGDSGSPVTQNAMGSCSPQGPGDSSGLPRLPLGFRQAIKPLYLRSVWWIVGCLKSLFGGLLNFKGL